ncbi:hypothetical protein MC885_013747 [Smutsia gigantea]|nr:hypothetical protein MC885_013747 [Smutsia gigantea]
MGADVILALNQTLLQQESLRAGSLNTVTAGTQLRHLHPRQLPASLMPLIFVFFFFLAEGPNFINGTLPPQERITAQELDGYFPRELQYKRNETMGTRVSSLAKAFFSLPLRLREEERPLLAGCLLCHLSSESATPEVLVPEAGCAAPSWMLHHVPPHGSADLPREAERRFQEKQRQPQRAQRHRQLSDLWVRLEER